MALKMTGVVPIFEASTDLTTARNDEEGRRAGAVVVADSSGFVLHRHADLARHGMNAALGTLAGQTVKTIDAPALAASGIDLGEIEAKPYPSAVRRAGLVSALHRSVGILFEDTDGSFRIVATQQWVCEPHGETYIRSRGGPCPNHTDGTLKPVP
jgi:hypothetical protein